MKLLLVLLFGALLLSACGGSSSGNDDDGLGNGDIARDNDTTGPLGDTDDPGEDQQCQPDCAGKTCGDDGCGGDCGQCNDGTCVLGECQANANCSLNGFTPAAQVATYTKKADGKDSLIWQGASSKTAPFDIFYIEDYQFAPYSGPTTPGIYDLAGTNYKDCGLCLLARTACSGNTCKKTFYADKGKVEILSLSPGDTKFKAILHGVQFKEVTINATTYQSTPVAGGQTWCMSGVTIDSAIQISETKPECVTAGTGAEWNDNIADFQLQNCNGKTVKLHSFCGKKAVWIAAVAGWCDACASLAPQMQKAQDDYGDAGLQVMLMLGENAYGNAPNLAYCKQWATSHKVDPANVYLDPSWTTLFTNINTYTGDTITLPFSIVLDGSNMEYIWADTSSDGDISSTLNSLLN